ncbi:MAG: hypothetical protein ACRDAO_01540 [Culicoidibacterales bacterium]
MNEITVQEQVARLQEEVTNLREQVMILATQYETLNEAYEAVLVKQKNYEQITESANQAKDFVSEKLGQASEYINEIDFRDVGEKVDYQRQRFLNKLKTMTQPAPPTPPTRETTVKSTPTEPTPETTVKSVIQSKDDK